MPYRDPQSPFEGASRWARSPSGRITLALGAALAVLVLIIIIVTGGGSQAEAACVAYYGRSGDKAVVAVVETFCNCFVPKAEAAGVPDKLLTVLFTKGGNATIQTPGSDTPYDIPLSEINTLEKTGKYFRECMMRAVRGLPRSPVGPTMPGL